MQWGLALQEILEPPFFDPPAGTYAKLEVRVILALEITSGDWKSLALGNISFCLVLEVPRVAHSGKASTMSYASQSRCPPRQTSIGTSQRKSGPSVNLSNSEFLFCPIPHPTSLGGQVRVVHEEKASTMSYVLETDGVVAGERRGLFGLADLPHPGSFLRQS